MPVVRPRHDAQREPGDFLAHLLDLAAGPTDHDGRMPGRAHRQAALADVEDAQAEGDEFLVDAGGEEQVIRARWRPRWASFW